LLAAFALDSALAAAADTIEAALLAASALDKALAAATDTMEAALETVSLAVAAESILADSVAAAMLSSLDVTEPAPPVPVSKGDMSR
jgi:hypothetical protein